jgi:hydrogenase maturation protease
VILIIGYGNPLRTDDAVGQIIAIALEGWREDIQIQTLYQLTPELVEPISQADHVFFVDARAGAEPGVVYVEPVEPQVDDDSPAGAFTHHISPTALLGGALMLYGSSPTGTLISIGAASFEHGTMLSPQLFAMFPSILEQVQEIIASVLSSP